MTAATTFQQARTELSRAKYERNGIRPLYQSLLVLEKRIDHDLVELNRLKKWAEIYLAENGK